MHIIESCSVAIASCLQLELFNKSCLQLELFNKSQVLGKA